MCGIFGYLGQRNAVPLVLEGLSKLEYRGYDSAGIAALTKDHLFVEKSVGPVSQLCSKVSSDMHSQVAIGHTRWATHGEPSRFNAHPHVDMYESCALVHNGIIENFQTLREDLSSKGVEFSSDTDTEVIVQLFASRYRETGDLVQSFSWTLKQLQGSFACALVHQDHPEILLCATYESPLILGLGEEEVFISSDVHAFLKYSCQIQTLASGELAVLRIGRPVEIYNFELSRIQKEVRCIDHAEGSLDKQGFDYYMLKEIYEQPEVFERILHFVCEENGFAESFLKEFSFEGIESLHIVACGSSYHAGCLAKYVIESMVSIPVYVETASEFRYRQPYIAKRSLAILISQSGETADTLAALNEFRKLDEVRVLGICNVRGSVLASRVDHCVFIEAGLEVGVASTKAFTAQLLVLILLGLKLASQRQEISKQDLMQAVQGLRELPRLTRLFLDSSIHDWRCRQSKETSFIFLGRRFMYPICMEAALKLKEIAYVEANAYPAGEMKHGPIALIQEGTPVIVYCGDPFVYTKTIGAIMEVKARKAYVIALARESNQDIAAVSDEQIYIPDSHDLAAPILFAIAGQIMAYTMALQKGTEVDRPRNLAKSVTVE
ncbi:glutamine--fructose-6-phosphate transaminase (isomerizing) [Chlamydia trachomatis]|jgi:glucosamine--fructose-6-phosphate aminotransferase (isomerizing)|uniref:Glutamine--fructose-6-phosphate aminotransferase [isomerizing] n=2 Tax=Chlamydia muridarum TaxID=83560 RepID=GLMS_CHLMU|nr:glutamine--fructose-6-phosphate transaminase (isomerizing) [Chlamydia muridarum]Q9PLA4.3 RecName: Full=Glutamine--fructose-6-phosphate aminotransferase [isomerizing]; AltName: Full=D-fructose-6-phosphate amidotransferase; AltName: Full=GFAT; AltName: Full=Glucosamine-6-phosphate synthase; AltName: Full=Hexosephosphate aminotransferase; AltName: Full=L-glutamine--D-fructose-6-phosphate amidotransferase [Chlamydia muridarum str. Nigg]UFV53776.1 glutamine--fructose-6-phosphate transaminase (isome